jgi:hypothetical protein
MALNTYTSFIVILSRFLPQLAPYFLQRVQFIYVTTQVLILLY